MYSFRQICPRLISRFAFLKPILLSIPISKPPFVLVEQVGVEPTYPIRREYHRSGETRLPRAYKLYYTCTHKTNGGIMYSPTFFILLSRGGISRYVALFLPKDNNTSVLKCPPWKTKADNLTRTPYNRVLITRKKGTKVNHTLIVTPNVSNVLPQ